MDMKKAMQRQETQHTKFLKQLVRVSIIDWLGNYVIRKPVREMDIVKDTEKYSVEWGNSLERMGGLKKKKAIPLQTWTGPAVSRILRLPDLKTNSI